jgi:hypothetical protein
MDRSTSSETNDQKLLRRKFSLRILLSIAVLGPLSLPVQAQTLAEWAYPVNPPLTPLDDTVQRHLAGSTKAYSQAQIDDGFDPAHRYPQDHPPMPDVVGHGREAAKPSRTPICPSSRTRKRRGLSGRLVSHQARSSILTRRRKEAHEAVPAWRFSANPAIAGCGRGNSTPTRIKAMSYTVSHLLLCSLHDVFGEIDPVLRRTAIDQIFHVYRARV